MKDVTGKKKSAFLRAALFLVAVSVSLEVAYVVGANLFLRLGGVQKALEATNTVQVDFDSAWTVWPFRVHVSGLRVLIQDHNVQSALAFDEVDVSLRARDLASRVFHATRVRGSGLSFRFRHRVDPEDAKSPPVAALPPIPGFEDPPVFEARVPEPPIPEDQYDLWTVHLEDVDVAASELWVQQFRYLGAARARGAFRLRPARTLWVGPASLDVSPGTVVVHEANALEQFAGRIDCTIEPFDVNPPEGLEVLRFVDAHARLNGVVVRDGGAELFLPRDARPQVQLSGARLEVDAHAKGGIFTPKSRVGLRGDTAEVGYGEVVVEARASPWSLTARGSEASRGIARFDAADLIAYSRSAPLAPAALHGIEAEVTSSTLDAVVPWDLVRATARVEDARVPDLRALDDVAHRAIGARLHRGSARFGGSVEYSHERLAVTASVDVKRLVAVLRGIEVRASTSGKGKFEKTGKSGRVADATVRASEVALRDMDGGRSCPWGRVGELEAGLHFRSARDGAIDEARVDASFSGASLLWGDLALSGAAAVKLELSPAPAEGERLAGDLRLLDGRIRATGLRLQSGGGPPDRWRASVSTAAIDLSWLVEDGMRFTGPIEVAAPSLRAAFGGVVTSADLGARFHVEEGDLLRRTALVRGNLNLSDARLSSGDRKVSDWWAAVELAPTRVTARDNLDLDGRATARFRDGLPALMVFASEDEIPGWLPGVLPLNDLAGTLRVRRRCQRTQIDLPHIAGGPLVARGQLRNEPGATSGAVLVQLSAVELVSAGAKLGPDGADVTLFAGEDWLKEELGILESTARESAQKPCVVPPPACSDGDESAEPVARSARASRKQEPSGHGTNGPSHGNLGARSPVAHR